MTAPLTRQLGRFVAKLRHGDLPPKIAARIAVAFTDTVGVMTAGAGDPAPRLLRTILAPSGGEATLFGDGARARAMDAAWINGTAAHALDYDDSSRRGGHVSAVLVPTILAEAQALGASGKRMITAYAAGFETLSELIWRDPGQHHEKGWHPTGVFGAVAAAAACASLRGLDADQAAMAIAIAGSQSAGLIANVGTMTKPLHAGRAAHTGVVSARLAQAGFTAAEDAMEHAPGFLTAFSPGGAIDVETPVRAGEVWRLCGENPVGVKQYPLCYYTHRTIDGTLDLMSAHPVRAVDIERITINISPRNATILRYALPQTGLEAKFSVQFAAACSIIAGRAGLSELTDEFVRREDVQGLMKRVVVQRDTRDDPNLPGYAIYDQTVIQLRDGSEVAGPRVNKVRGGSDLPLTRPALRAKFDDCMRYGGAPATDEVFDMLMGLDRLEHVAPLLAALVPVAGTDMNQPGGKT